MRADTLLEAVPEFEAVQAGRCRDLGIDVSSYDLSHVAYRCRTWREYVEATPWSRWRRRTSTRRWPRG